MKHISKLAVIALTLASGSSSALESQLAFYNYGNMKEITREECLRSFPREGRYGNIVLHHQKGEEIKEARSDPELALYCPKHHIGKAMSLGIGGFIEIGHSVQLGYQLKGEQPVNAEPNCSSNGPGIDFRINRPFLGNLRENWEVGIYVDKERTEWKTLRPVSKGSLWEDYDVGSDVTTYYSVTIRDKSEGLTLGERFAGAEVGVVHFIYPCFDFIT